MKLLVLDINMEITNPMWNNFKNAFSYEFDVKKFGPGYVSEETLKQGLLKYIEKNNGFDLILVTNYFLVSAIGTEWGDLSFSYLLHRVNVPRYNILEMERYGTKIVKELEQCKDVKKILMFTSDVAYLSKSRADKIRKLLNQGYYILWWGLQFATQKFSEKYFCGALMTMEHLKICEEYYEQVISIPPAAVNEDNIEFSELEARKYDWIVAGNIKGYPSREKVQKLLKAEGYNLWNEDELRTELIYRSSKITNFQKLQYRNWAERIIANIGNDCKEKNTFMPVHLSSKELGGFREQYRESLKNVKYAYMNGGPANFLVGKYMEVPASGAVMVGDMVYGLKEMGFVSGKHIIELPIEKINKKAIDEISNNIDYMQKISDNARKLVIEKHTFRNRAHSLKKACERILEGTYRGGYWEEGEFYLED